MKQGLLTDRQKEVLRYRKQGLTQQQIAEIIHTSKANVYYREGCSREHSRARETLEFLTPLMPYISAHSRKGLTCSRRPEIIYAEAEKQGVKVKYDTITL